ncbi:hypothetical protein O3P69_009876 [Scylla paramamosain]|uniref:Uncharacterized protein n=1 Tax=Scylla paramamosain TaxID=85552 RepID=A0AAW0SNL1_SCYPA
MVRNKRVTDAEKLAVIKQKAPSVETLPYTEEGDRLCFTERVAIASTAMVKKEQFVVTVRHPTRVTDAIIDGKRKEQIESNRHLLVPVIETALFCDRNMLSLCGHRDDGPLDLTFPSTTGEGVFRGLLRYRTQVERILAHTLEPSRTLPGKDGDLVSAYATIRGIETIFAKIRPDAENHFHDLFMKAEELLVEVGNCMTQFLCHDSVDDRPSDQMFLVAAVLQAAKLYELDFESLTHMKAEAERWAFSIPVFQTIKEAQAHSSTSMFTQSRRSLENSIDTSSLQRGSREVFLSIEKDENLSVEYRRPRAPERTCSPLCLQ